MCDVREGAEYEEEHGYIIEDLEVEVSAMKDKDVETFLQHNVNRQLVHLMGHLESATVRITRVLTSKI